MKLTPKLLKRLIKETIRENSMLLNEALGRDYYSLMESLEFSGDTSAFGIMSAQNPMATANLSEEENERRAQELVMDLDGEQWDYVPIGGKYGGVDEKSNVINNPSHEDMVRLCGKYQQESYVWGSVEDEPRYRLMEIVYDEEGNAIGSKLYTKWGAKPTDLLIKEDDDPNLKNAEDNYSELDGKKFVFPFFGMP